MKLMYLCVAVGDEHIVWFVQAPRPGTELFLGQLGKGRAEAEAIINIMRDKEAILIQEIQIRATMENQEQA